MKTKSILAVALISSNVSYYAHSFVSLPLIYLTKLHTLMIRTARWILGDYCYKQACTYIYEKANLLDGNQLIVISSHRFISKVVSQKIPALLHKRLVFPKRICNKITMSSKGRFSSSNYIYIGLKCFNEMPQFNLNCKKEYKESLRAAVTGAGTALALIRKARA